MGREDAAVKQSLAFGLVLIMVASGTVVAAAGSPVDPAATAPEAQIPDAGHEKEARADARPDLYLPQDSPSRNPGSDPVPKHRPDSSLSPPEPDAAPESLDALITRAQDDVPQHVQQWLPAPTDLTGYGGLDDEEKQAAWEGWWAAGSLAAKRMRAAQAVTDARVQTADHDDDHDEDHDDEGRSGEADNATLEEPLPYKEVEGAGALEPWWSARMQGAPQAVHSAGPDGAIYLVTDRGVVFYPDPQEEASWMLQTTGVPGRSETAPGDGDVHDLVVSTHPLYLEDDEPSLRVVGGGSGELLFEGLSGEKALLSWRLTDVDGDGRLDVLGLDRSLNLTALALDGSEIYRVPLPTPDLPEAGDAVPFLPGFLTLVWEQTGMEAFGEATGDDTLDLFVPNLWHVRLGLQDWATTPVVSLVSGAGGELVWSTPLEPATIFSFQPTIFAPVAAGDLTGDGREDVVVMDYYPTRFFGDGGPVMYLLAGEDGRLIAREDMGALCPFCPQEFDEDWFEAVAVVDLDGDGRESIVGVYRDRWNWWEVKALGVWSLEMGPEGSVGVLEMQETHSLGPLEVLYPFEGRFMVRTLPDTAADGFYLLVGQEVRTSTGVLFELSEIHRLDGDGHEPFTPREPLGHWDLDAATGQAYGWTLSDDRWVSLDEATHRVDNGTPLFMSVQPLLFHDQNGDSLKDVLVAKTAGYRWLDGRTGAVLEEIERPRDVRFLQAMWAGADPYLLEEVEGSLVLYDVEDHDVAWSIGADKREDADVAAVADFTGNGRFEVLLHALGEWQYEWGGTTDREPVVTDERWFLYDPQDNETVWNHTAEDHGVHAVDALRSRSAKQMLVTGWEEGEYRVSLWRPQDDVPLWNRTFQDGRFLTAEDGHVLLDTETPNGTHYTVLDGASGGTLASWERSHDEDRVWIRFQDLDGGGAPMLVESYVQEVVGMTDAMRQFVRTTDWQRGETVGHYRMLDPPLREESGDGWSVQWYEYTWAGPVVGDWDGQGLNEMAFTEDRRAVVRSLADGEVVAAAPRGGFFIDAVDLDGDVQNEVARLSSNGGSLQVYAYNPDARLGEDGALTRLGGDGQDEGRGPGPQGGSTEASSADPGLWIVAGLLVATVAGGGWFVKKRRSTG